MPWITTGTFIISFLIISLIASVFLLYVTIHSCHSEKKNWFELCLIAMLFFILGNFMELTSHSTEAALNGVKVMYVGACFISPIFLLFTMDYCEIKIASRWPKALLLAIAMINLILVWTTEHTHLVYVEYQIADDPTVHGLQIIKQGPAYYFAYGYALVCIGISVAVILHRIFKWDKRMRFSLVLLMLSAAATLLANVFYILNSYVFPTVLQGVNLTPFALIITNVFFYVNVLRYDLFDFAPRARSVTLDMIRDGVLFFDEQLRYTYSNEIAQSLLPELRKLGKGKPITDMETWPKELAHLDINDTQQNIPLGIQGENGADTRFFNAWVNSVQNSGKALGVVVLLQDVTEHSLLLKKLEDAAYTDGLTGLFNRKHFMELVLMELERTRRMGAHSCFLLYDLDFFKKVNDVYGHLAGDEVLRTVAQKVKQAVRAYDIVARYGGEEFVVFLADTEREAAVMLAERIRESIESASCVYEGTQIHITCSIGVTEVAKDASLDDALKKADQAMYKAKESGRNRVCVL